jgi:hypothetical protein
MSLSPCLECGRQLSEEITVCPRCGQSAETFPMNRLGAYVGENWGSHYRAQFQRLLNEERGGSHAGWTWNWSAALTPFWFLYRRLYGAFFLYALLHLCLGPFGLSLIIAITQGTQGDRLLYRKARAVVLRAGESCDAGWLSQRGKPLAWVPWSPVALIAVGVLLAVVLPRMDDRASREGATQDGAPLAGAPWTSISTDGQTQITVPATWRTLADESGKMEMKVGSVTARRFVAVFTESRSKVPGADLDAYTAWALDDYHSQVADGTASAPHALTIGGSPAIQYELSDPSDVTWLTVIQTENNFHRVVAWTSLGQADEFRPLFQNVLESFREIPRQGHAEAPSTQAAGAAPPLAPGSG